MEVFQIIKNYPNITAEAKVENDVVRITGLPDTYSTGRVIGSSSVESGKVYTIRISVQRTGETSQAVVIASWHDGEGTMIARNYLLPDGEDHRSITVHAPEGATQLLLEREFYSYGGGFAEFGIPEITCLGEYKPRLVTLATTWFPCRRVERTLEQNLDAVLTLSDRAAAQGADLVVFSEAIYGRGVDIPLTEEALTLDSEPVQKMAAKAKEHSMYLVVGLHLLLDGVFKNAAVVFDRQGEIAGIYIKTHLPMEEKERGFVAGRELPVFDLDFGKLGILICWDHMFSEPARVLHLKGAEVIAVPTAGDSYHQSRARAMDSGAYLLTSSLNGPEHSAIVSPLGETLTQVSDTDAIGGIAVTTVDLNRRQYQYWMSVGPGDGEPRDLFRAERCPWVYDDLQKSLV